MNLKEKRAAAVRKAQELMERVRKEQREFSEEETKLAQSLAAEIAEYDAALVKASQAEAARTALDAVAGEEPADGTGEAEDETVKGREPASLSEFFFAKGGKEYGAKKRVPGSTVSVAGFKANTDVQKLTTSTENILRLASPRLIPEFQMRLTVADLLGVGQVSPGQTSIPYLVEGAFEGDFAAIAEGTEAPQVHFAEPTAEYERFHRIAGFIGVTDEMLNDDVYMKNQIDTRLPYKLLLQEEKQLLAGDGSGENLRGLLNRSGIQTLANSGSGTALPNEELILKAKTLIETAQEFPVDAIVINPLDYFDLRVKKDQNGQYLGGGFFQGQYGNGGGLADAQNLWGLPTVQTPAIPQGTVLIGALKAQTERIVKDGVTIEYTNTHDRDFIKFQGVMRAYVRESLGVFNPKAICKITLGAGA